MRMQQETNYHLYYYQLPIVVTHDYKLSGLKPYKVIILQF